MTIRFFWCLAVTAGWAALTLGQDAEPAAEKTPAGGAAEKALKYYEALVKRPAAGYLFDRFYNAWLDTRTVEDLEKFLKEKAAAAGATTGHRLVLAFFYAKQNEHAKALEQFRAALEKDPGNADAWFQKAGAEARTLDFDAALKDLAKALESKPSAEMTRQIQQLRGKLLARNGKNEEAMKAWKELLEAHPDDEDLQEDLIELQISEGLNSEALQTAELLLGRTKDPYKKVQRRLRVGDIHTRMGNRDQAVEAYSKCLDEVGGNSWLEKEILGQIEQTFRRDDALEELKQHYAALAKKYPQRLALRRATARLQAETGQFDAAVKSFQEILAVTPGDREVREAYVQLLAEGKKVDDAVAQLRELIKLHPEDGELLVKLADLYFQAGKNEDVQKTLEEFLAKSDPGEQAHLRTAGLLERFKLGEASLALFQKTAEKFPDSEAARDSHAVALHKSGRKNEALAAWRRAAQGADKVRVMNVARSAAARDEHGLAFELLSARIAEFGADVLFLTQLCESAQRVEKFAEALPWARKLVELAAGPVELDAALAQATRITERADKVEETITGLRDAKLPQAKCFLADLLERTGDSKAAAALLQEVTQENAEMGTALLVRLQVTRGDYPAAAETLRRLVEGPGGRKPAHVQRLVELFEKAGLLDKALAWIPEWKKLTPGSTQAWLKEADLQASLGKVKEALLCLRQASQQFEGNEDVRAQLGAAYRAEGKLADAERVFTQLYEEAKDMSAKVRWAGELAQTAEQSGKTAELVEAFEERRRSNRASLQPLLALAEIHRVAGNYEGRRAALVEAARLKRDDADLLLEIARIEESEGDFDRALQTLKEAQALGNSDKVRNRMVRVLFGAGKDDEGLKLMQEIAGGDKMDARAGESLADSLIQQDSWAEAADFLAPLTVRFPKDYRLAYQYAVALEESDRKKAALAQFQRILAMTEELPPAPGSTAAPGLANPRQNDYLQAMRETLPAAAMTFMELTQFSYQALSYKQQRRSGGPFASSGGQSRLALPQSVDEAPRYAFAHLATLAEELEPADRDALLKDLKSQGRLPGDLLDLIKGGRINLNSPDFADVLEKNPDNETLLAITAFYGMSNENLDPKLRLRVFEKFRTSRPQLAVFSVLTQGRSDTPEVRKAFADAVGLIEQMEQPKLMVISALGQVFNRQGDEADAAAEDKDYAALTARLRQKLLAWQKALDPSNPLAGQIMNMVFWDVLARNDPKELLEMFDAEVVRFNEQAGKKPGGRGMIYYGGYPVRRQSSRGNFDPVTFPPASLPDFPPQILGLLSSADSGYYYGRRWEPDAEKIKPLLPGVKNPILRVLVASKIEDTETVTATLKALVEAREPSFSALVLAAAWAASQDKFDEAVTMVRKAEYLPLTKEQRRMVDTSILAWALQHFAGKKPAEESPVLTAGREAALRMRRDSLTPEQKGQLAEAMEILGLDQEAKRLTAALQAAGASGGGLGSLMGSGASYQPSTPSAKNKLEALMEKGKREGAVQAALKDLRGFSKAWLASHDDSLQYQAREWMESITRYALQADLLKAVLASGTSEDARAIAEAAAACDILGKKTEARQLYGKAMEKRPTDQNIRFAYTVNLMKDQPAEAAKLLKDLDPNLVSQAGSLLGNLIDNLSTHEERFAVAAVVESFLLNFKSDAAKTDLSWIDYFVNQFARNGYVQRGEGLPSLYARPGTDDSGSAATEGTGAEQKAKLAEREKLIKERRRLHDSICQRALTIPQTARSAFAKLAGLALQEGTPLEKVAEMARQALQTELSQKNPPNGRYSMMSYDDGESIPLPEPEEVLLEHAMVARKPEIIADEIIPLLKTGRQPQRAKDLELDAKLYFCAAQDFPAAAQDYAKRKARTTGSSENGAIWRLILKIVEKRKLDVDLTDAILADLKKSPTDNYGSGELLHVATHAKHLAKSRSPEVAGGFLDRVAEIYLGPKEKREEFLKKNYVRNSVSSRTANAGIHKWLYLFRNLGTSEDGAFLLLDSFESNFRAFNPGPSAELYLNSSEFLRPVKYGRDVPKTIGLLRKSPFLAAGKDFRTYVLRNDYRSFFSDTMDQLRNLNKEQRAALLKALEAEPKTLGAVLVAGSLAENPRTGLANAIGAMLNEIKALPAGTQGEIVNLTKWAARLYSSMDTKSLTEDGRKAAEWLDGFRDDSQMKSVERIMAAKNLAALGMSEYDLRSFVSEALAPVIKTDPARASQVLSKLRDLVADFRKTNRGSSSYSFGDGSSALGYGLYELLNRLVQQTSPKLTGQHALNALSVAAEAWAAKNGYPIEYGTNSREAAGSLLVVLGNDDKGKFSPETFIRTAGRLPADAGRIYFNEVGAVLRTRTGKPGAPEFAAARDWMTAQAAGGEPHAWMAQLALHALNVSTRADAIDKRTADLRKAEEAKAKAENREPAPVNPVAWEGIMDEAKLPPEQKYVLDLARQEAWNLSVRIALLHGLLRDAKETAEPAVRIAAAKLLAQAWREGAYASSGDASRILRRLSAWAAAPGAQLPEDVRAAGAELLAAWRKLAQKGNFGGTAGEALLDLAIALQDDAGISQIVSGALPSASRLWLGRLVGCRQFEAAKRLMQGAKDSLYGNETPSLPEGAARDNWQYNAALAGAAPEFLATLDAGPQKYAVEVLLAALPDSPDVKRLKLPARQARLVEVAKKYPAAEMNNPDLAERLLQFLVSDDAAAAALPPDALKGTAEHLSFTALPDLDNSSLEGRRKAILTAHLRQRIDAGDLDFMRKTLTDLLELRTNDEYDLRRLASEVVTDCISRSNAVWASLNPAARKANREFWRDLLFNAQATTVFDSYTGTGASQRLVHVLMLHAVDDAMPEFSSAWEKLDTDSKTRLDNAARSLDFAREVDALATLAWPEKDPDKARERSRRVLKMLETPTEKPGSGKFWARYFSDLVTNKLLTPEDFTANLEHFAATMPRGGYTAVEAAEVAIRNGKDQEAAAWLERAEKEKPWTSTLMAMHGAILQSNAWLKLGKAAKAQQVLTAVPEAKLKELRDGNAATMKAYDQALKDVQTEAAFEKDGPAAFLAESLTALQEKPGDAAAWEKAAAAFNRSAEAYKKRRDDAKSAPYFAAAALAWRALELRKTPNSAQVADINLAAFEAATGSKTEMQAVLLAKGYTWKFLDGGQAPPDRWQQPDFDANAWKSGNAPLGYGEKGLATEITPGGEEKNRPMAACFRTEFAVEDPAAWPSLGLQVRRDDGAVVYLNGAEILRDNLPEGQISFTTAASKTVNNADETNFFAFTVDGKHLKKGKNILAVEVHQDRATSSDLSFDLTVGAPLPSASFHQP